MMAAEPEPAAEPATEKPPKPNEPKGKAHTGFMPKQHRKPLRVTPVKVFRKKSARNYKFICNLDRIPTEESLGRDLGPGVYRLEGAGGGQDVFNIGELETPASVYAEPEPFEPEPLEPLIPPSSAPVSGQGINVAHRLGLMEARLQYGFRAINRVCDRLEQSIDELVSAQEEATDELKDEIYAVQKYLSAIQPPEAPAQKGLLEQIQELAAMKAAFGNVQNLFGEPADPNSIMSVVGPELAGFAQDFRRYAMPQMQQQAQGYPQGNPQQQGQQPQQQGFQPQQQPPPPPGYSHFDPQRGWVPLQQATPQAPPQGPQIPGLTQQNAEEIWGFAVKLGQSTYGRAFTWEEIGQFAAMHSIGAAELLEMARGEREVPGMEASG